MYTPHRELFFFTSQHFNITTKRLLVFIKNTFQHHPGALKWTDVLLLVIRIKMEEAFSDSAPDITATTRPGNMLKRKTQN